ncbi:MAG: PspA/IM30 family protein [Proteobacteria bacterium]|nr:PspA/IM30 family protein [Pseudomonadota bacterium]
MSAFSRLRYIITANVNSLLEKAEDPQKLLKALIREMEDARIEARQALTDMLAEVKVLEASQSRLGSQIKSLETEAEKQVLAENEVAARRALAQKSVQQKQLQEQERQLGGLRERISSIETDINTLQERYQSALELRKRWTNKSHPVKIDSSTASLTRGQQRMRNTLNRFEQLQQQVDNLEARVQAEDEAHRYFDTPKNTNDNSTENLQIEAELEALNQRLHPQIDVAEAKSA